MRNARILVLAIVLAAIPQTFLSAIGTGSTTIELTSTGAAGPVGAILTREAQEEVLSAYNTLIRYSQIKADAELHVGFGTNLF